MRSINKMAKLKTPNHFSKNRFSSFRARTTEEGGTGVRTEAARNHWKLCMLVNPSTQGRGKRMQEVSLPYLEKSCFKTKPKGRSRNIRHRLQTQVDVTLRRNQNFPPIGQCSASVAGLSPAASVK